VISKGIRSEMSNESEKLNLLGKRRKNCGSSCLFFIYLVLIMPRFSFKVKTELKTY
jgi:hypothetical protein